MTSSETLERALQARWDPETLRVYADALQAAGDPRGELIALDLEIATRGVTPELAQRRRRRIYEWLGGATLAGRPVHEATFRDGFATDVHVRSAADLEALYASPAGPFVRGLDITVTAAWELRDAFAVIARSPRPWLERLAVRVLEPSAVVPDAALIAATPRLARLAAPAGLASFPHPSVRTLVTASAQLPLASTLPALDTLDLELDAGAKRDNESGYDWQIMEQLYAQRSPRVLDLSRNEARADDDHAYRFVRWVPLVDTERVRLPSLRSAAQAKHLGERVEVAPGVRFEVARTYARDAALLATVTDRLVMPAPYPWSPVDAMSSREALTITVPTEEHGDDVGLVHLVGLLETQFPVLPPNARAHWLAFWDFLGGLPWEDRDGHEVTRTFPAAPLLTALEALDDVDPYDGTSFRWAQLAETLRAADLPVDAVVGVRRFWGW